MAILALSFEETWKLCLLDSTIAGTTEPTDKDIIIQYLRTAPSELKTLYQQSVEKTEDLWKKSSLEAFFTDIYPSTPEYSLFSDFRRAKLSQKEPIQMYIQRLKLLARKMPHLDTDTLVFAKIAFEAPAYIKGDFSVTHPSLGAYVAAWQEKTQAYQVARTSHPKKQQQSKNRPEPKKYEVKTEYSTGNSRHKPQVQQKNIQITNLLHPLVYDTISVKNTLQRAMLDSGAQLSTLPLSTARELCIDFHEKNIDATVGNNIKTFFLGYTNLTISNPSNNTSAEIPFIIGNDESIILNGAAIIALRIDLNAKLEENQAIYTAVEKKLASAPEETKQNILSHPKIFNAEYSPSRYIAKIPWIQKPKLKICKSFTPSTEEKKSFLKQLVLKEIADDKLYCIKDPKISSRTFVVEQRNKYRLVIDGRYINQFIQKMYVKLPDLLSIRSEISQSTEFSVFDLQAAFRSIPLNEKDQLFFSYDTYLGTFASKYLNFGFSISLQLFHTYLQQEIARFQITKCIQFVDDILLYGSRQEVTANTTLLIKLCLQNALKLNIAKSQIHQAEVTYLGHHLSSTSITLENSRITELKSLPKPTNIKQLQRVMGKFQFVSRFIKNFGKITSNLSPKHQFEWGEPQDKAWSDLKNSIDTINELFHPPEEAIVDIAVHIDSDSLEATLFFDEKPIIFIHKLLRPAEKRYSFLEKYLLGLAHSLETTKMPLARQTRISAPPAVITLLKSDELFQISSRLQKLIARILSFDVILDTTRLQIKSIFQINTDNSTSPVQLASTDEILADQKSLNLSRHDHSIGEDGIARKSGATIVSISLASTILSNIHNAAHNGPEAMVQCFKRMFICPHIRRTAQKIFKKCTICLQINKAHPSKPGSLETALFPRHIGAFDLFDYEGDKYIALIDYFSLFTFCERLPSKNAKDIIQFFIPIFEQYKFHTLYSDNEPTLNSAQLAQFFASTECKRKNSLKYHPQSNGLIEGRIGALKNKMDKALLLNYHKESALAWALNALNYFPAKRKSDFILSPAQRFWSNCSESLQESEVPRETLINKPGYAKLQGHISKKFVPVNIISTYGNKAFKIIDENQKEHIISKAFLKMDLSSNPTTYTQLESTKE